MISPSVAVGLVALESEGLGSYRHGYHMIFANSGRAVGGSDPAVAAVPVHGIFGFGF